MDRGRDLTPIVAGLTVGILFVLFIGLVFRPGVSLAVSEFIQRSKNLREYFLSKYPEARERIERYHEGTNDVTLVEFAVQKDVYEPNFEEVDSFGRNRELALILEHDHNPF